MVLPFEAVSGDDHSRWETCEQAATVGPGLLPGGMAHVDTDVTEHRPLET
jgi:hypothetical protein